MSNYKHLHCDCTFKHQSPCLLILYGIHGPLSISNQTWLASLCIPQCLTSRISWPLIPKKTTIMFKHQGPYLLAFLELWLPVTKVDWCFIIPQRSTNLEYQNLWHNRTLPSWNQQTRVVQRGSCFNLGSWVFEIDNLMKTSQSDVLCRTTNWGVRVYFD